MAGIDPKLPVVTPVVTRRPGGTEEKRPPAGLAGPDKAKEGEDVLGEAPPEETGGAAQAVLDPLAIPAADDPNYAAVQQLLQQLIAAQGELKTIVAKKEEEAKAEEADAQKRAAKKKLQLKAEQAQKKLQQLQLKAQAILKASPALRAKYSAQIAAALQQATALADLASQLTGVDDTHLEALLGTLEAKSAELEGSLQEVEKGIQTADHDNLMKLMFGPNWDKSITYTALADGAITEDEIIDGSEAEEVFHSFGDISIDANGLTLDELATLAKAKQQLVIFLGGSLEEGSVKQANVEQTIDKIIELAGKGELDVDTLNELLEPLGIEFTAEAFAQIFLGQSNSIFVNEKVTDVRQMCKHLNEMYQTALMQARESAGYGVDVAGLGADELLDPSKAALYDRTRQELAATFVDYAKSDVFYDIKISRFSQLFQGTLAQYAGLDGSQLSPEELWKQLEESGEIPEWLKQAMKSLDEKSALSAEQKWNEIAKQLVGRIYAQIKTPNAPTREEAYIKKIAEFRRLVEAMQADDLDPIVQADFMRECEQVIIGGQKGGPFNVDTVLDGEAGVLALAGQ